MIIIDDSDENWWKGSNHRGEGLFPANFVSKDLTSETEEKEKRRRSVQFNDEVEVKTVEHAGEWDCWTRSFQQLFCILYSISDLRGPVTIDEEKIRRVLDMLNDADPASGEHDPPEMVGLEEQANQMGPMIDAELEVVDRRLAQLTRLSTELVDALNLYHQLMRELPGAPPATSGMGMGMYHMSPGHPMPNYPPVSGYMQPPPPVMSLNDPLGGNCS